MPKPATQSLSALALNDRFPAIAREQWVLDPGCTFLNHGSFGACPRVVLEKQQALRDKLEAGPLRFLLDDVPPLVDASRDAVAELIGADSSDVVFVQNATAGCNAVLRSLRFEEGDEILILDHAYNACANIARFVAERAGAKVVVAKLPWPVASPDDVVDAVLGAVTDKTCLAMIDHITSPSAMVLPIETIVRELQSRGVDTLVDGAHGPGMVAVDVKKIGAAWYTGNCHKWLCTPKAAAFLHARDDKQQDIQPAILSHGSNHYGKGPGDFQMRFSWPATDDPTARCCVKDSIAFLNTLMPGGLDALMQRNRDQTLALRKIVCEAWGVAPPCPESMIGSMATIPIRNGGKAQWDRSPEAQAQLDLLHHVQRELRVEVPFVVFADNGILHTRFSTQAYNAGGDIVALIDAFKDVVDL